MGGPGYLISEAALLQLAPHLSECVHPICLGGDSHLWHSDVAIALMELLGSDAVCHLIN